MRIDWVQRDDRGNGYPLFVLEDGTEHCLTDDRGNPLAWLDDRRVSRTLKAPELPKNLFQKLFG